MGVYNVTRCCPKYVELVKHSNERKAFIDIIKDDDSFKGNICLFDRGFGSDAQNSLIKKGIYFVCRMKDNSLLIPEGINDIVNINGDNIRVVTYTIGNSKYYMATNLMDVNEFPIEKIEQLYHQRWSVEELFKYIKNNFDFSYMGALSEETQFLKKQYMLNS